MRILFLLIPLFCSVASAQVNVSFFRMYSPEGKLIQLEENGEFFHVAVQIEDGRWIHTHPQKGVELVEDLNALGEDPLILTSLNESPISFLEVMPFLGLPFDFQFNWNDNSTIYCSKLAGTLLKIEPKPTCFSTEVWKEREIVPGMERGLSPDDVYKELIARGFLVSSNTVACDRFLVTPFMRSLLDAK